MKAYICDMCGDVIDYILQIRCNPKSIKSHKEWSSGIIEGEYCAKCAALINDSIFDLLPKHKKEDESIIMQSNSIHQIDGGVYHKPKEN